ncbi:cell wall metabolism sensor histidine kinase WalK [Patescibacteria group bacterium]|nr:cell wall metabolism sensor histidine kinase WalK [Patescibacteria group bacterium]
MALLFMIFLAEVLVLLLKFFSQAFPGNQVFIVLYGGLHGFTTVIGLTLFLILLLSKKQKNRFISVIYPLIILLLVFLILVIIPRDTSALYSFVLLVLLNVLFYFLASVLYFVYNQRGVAFFVLAQVVFTLGGIVSVFYTFFEPIGLILWCFLLIAGFLKLGQKTYSKEMLVLRDIPHLMSRLGVKMMLFYNGISVVMSIVVLGGFFLIVGDSPLVYRFFLVYLFFIVVSNAFVGIVVSRGISSRLRKLHEGVSKIQEGELDYRFKKESEDEIGELAHAFNDMAQDIAKSREDIDKKVEERTFDVLSKQKELEEAQRATLNILEDVQNEKDRAEFEIRRIEAIISSIGDGLFVTDKYGRIVLFNPMAEKISGFKEKDVLGKKYSDVLEFYVDNDTESKLFFVEKTLQSGKLSSIGRNVVLRTKSKDLIPIADSIAPVKRGKEVVGAIVVFRDATKEREIDKMKSGFVSIASHQLRTPLTAIKWLLEMIMDKSVGTLNEEQEDYITQAFDSNERLIGLVNDLLKVSRLEEQRVKVKPQLVHIEDILDNIVKEHEINARAHGCTIKTTWKKLGTPKIKVDPLLIKNVVDNLISNAIEYSEGKNVITLSVKEKAKNIEISVKDKGVGIPKKDQGRVFNMFYRSDEAVKLRAEGSGLGLYIAKMIVNISGGKIWFDSKEGKGTTFYFTLPLSGSKKKNAGKGIE